MCSDAKKHTWRYRLHARIISCGRSEEIHTSLVRLDKYAVRRTDVEIVSGKTASIERINLKAVFEDSLFLLTNEKETSSLWTHKNKLNEGVQCMAI